MTTLVDIAPKSSALDALYLINNILLNFHNIFTYCSAHQDFPSKNKQKFRLFMRIALTYHVEIDIGL